MAAGSGQCFARLGWFTQPALNTVSLTLLVAMSAWAQCVTKVSLQLPLLGASMIGKIIRGRSKLVRRLIRVATRVFPFGSLSNRLIVSQFAEAGDNVRFYGKPNITGADKIVAGCNVHIGSGSFIRAEGGLSIGDNCHISRNSLIYTLNHDHAGEFLPYDSKMCMRKVTIGKNVWIGMNVCVVPGARIGDGAIIGMGSVVAGEVPELAIVGSAPLRVLGYRNADHYEFRERNRAYGGKDGHPYTGRTANGSACE